MTNLWKIEAHAHTGEISLCAKMTAAEMVQQCKAAGCDAVIATDHYTPEFFAEDLTPEAYAARVDDFFAGYRAAKAEGDRIGIAVFPALEVRIDAGREDYLIYGISPEELKSLGNLAYLTLEQLRDKVHATAHGLLIQAHPFRGYLNCQPAHLLDGVEVNNANPRHDSHNDQALAFAQTNDLLQTSGSDVHELGDAGSAMMTCPPFASIGEFADFLRAGKTTVALEK